MSATAGYDREQLLAVARSNRAQYAHTHNGQLYDRVAARSVAAMRQELPADADHIDVLLYLTGVVTHMARHDWAAADVANTLSRMADDLTRSDR